MNTNRQLILIGAMTVLFLLVSCRGGEVTRDVTTDSISAVPTIMATAAVPTDMPDSDPDDTGGEAAVPTEEVTNQDEGSATDEADSDNIVADASNDSADPLPELPRIDSGNTPAIGGLGGGGGAASEAVVAEPLPIDPAGTSIMVPTDFFSGTNFVLTAALETTAIQSANAWRQDAYTLSLEDAYALINRFGFPGPLYQDILPPEVREGIPQMAEGVWRIPFYAINGDQIMTISGGTVFIENRAASYDTGAATITLDQLRPVVEAQLSAWGGLDFDYVLASDGPGNVLVKRVVDGYVVDYPELFFQYNDDSALIFASYNALGQPFDVLGNYPLITAEAAWQQIVDGVAANQIPWQYVYDANNFAVALPEPGEALDYQFWERAFIPGADVVWFGYPRIYLPVQDDGAPRAEAGQFQLIAAPEDLFAMTTAGPGEMAITGTVSEDGRTIQVSSFERLDQNQTLFLEGRVVRSGEAVQLETIDGQLFLLPDAPADLDDGLEVFVFAWRSRTIDGQSIPVLDWGNIDKKIVFDEPQLRGEPVIDGAAGGGLVEPGFFGPVFDEITVDSVELAYFYQQLWPEISEQAGPPEFDLPPVIIQPVWRFTGTATSGETLQFNVPAVTPGYFE